MQHAMKMAVRWGVFWAALAAVQTGCGNDVKCGEGTVLESGVCLPETSLSCAEGTAEKDGECVPDGTVICQTGTRFDPETGRCRPDIEGCGEGTVLLDGECVPEDDTLSTEIVEPLEPNGLEPNAQPGGFTLPDEGESITVGGCVTPFEDLDGDGLLDPDYDAFLFDAPGPVVLDVTADGVEGLAGGFIVVSLEPELQRDEWQRFGVSLVSDTSERKVFLPEAGTYALLFGDSRSIEFDGAFGDPDTCYYATVAVESVPSPDTAAAAMTGTLGAPEFFQWNVSESDAALRVLLDGLGPATQGGVTLLVNGELRASFADVSPEDDLRRLHDLDSGDEVLIAIDAVYDISLTGHTYAAEVSERIPLAEPGDGTPTEITHDAKNPRALLKFDAQAGDVVHLQLAPVAGPYEIRLYPPSATDLSRDVISVVCDLCSDADQWVRVQETGTYYLQIENFLGKDGVPYSVAFSRTHRTPQAIAAGTPATADLTNGDGVAFFSLDASAAPDWIELSAQPVAGTVDQPIAVFYDGAGQGALDQQVLADQAGVASSMGRILLGDDSPYLIAVFDAAPDGDEVLSVEVSERSYTAAIADANTDHVEVDTPLSSGGANYYLVAVPAQSLSDIEVTSAEGVDPVIEVLDRFGDAAEDGSDAGGLGEGESLQAFAPTTRLLLRVRDAADAGGGQYDLQVATSPLSPTSVSASPVVAIPDDDSSGVTSTVDVTACDQIAGVLVDIDITHSFRGDLSLSLKSPSGTKIHLKSADVNDPGDDLIGTFGDDLTPAESLDAFGGQDGAGTWTLTAVDTATGDQGTLNSWTLHLFCF